MSRGGEIASAPHAVPHQQGVLDEKKRVGRRRPTEADERSDTGSHPMSTVSDTRQTAEAPDEARVAHRAHWGWWILTVFVLLFAGGIVQMLFTNPNLGWDVVAGWFFSQSIVYGLLRTIELTVL